MSLRLTNATPRSTRRSSASPARSSASEGSSHFERPFKSDVHVDRPRSGVIRAHSYGVRLVNLQGCIARCGGVGVGGGGGGGGGGACCRASLSAGGGRG